MNKEALIKDLNEVYNLVSDHDITEAMERLEFVISEIKQLHIPVVSNMLPDEIDGFLNYIRETCVTDCNDWHNLLHNKQFDSNHELYRQYLKDKK